MDFELSYLPKSKEPEQESQGGSALRNVARSTARATESVLGLPGDIASGVLGLTNLGISKLTGSQSPLPSSLPIPTSETVKEYVTKPIEKKLLPEGYLEPKGEYEELSDAFVGDVASLLVPLKTKIPFQKSLLKAGAIAGAGNLASFGAKKLGVGEKGQAGVKIGTMLATSLIGPKSVKNYMNGLYDNAENLVAEKAKVSAEAIKPNLKKLNKILDLGIMTPTKEKVAKAVSGIESKISRGKIAVKEAIELKRNINELAYSKEAKGIEKLLPTLTEDLNKTIAKYGVKNPEFFSNWTQAEDIYKGLNTHSKTSKFLQKAFSNEKLIGTGATAVLTGANLPFTAKALLGGLTAKESLKFAESLKNSSAIRNYYLKTINAAAKENLPLSLKYIGKLNSELDNENISEESGGDFEVTKL